MALPQYICSMIEKPTTTGSMPSAQLGDHGDKCHYPGFSALNDEVRKL